MPFMPQENDVKGLRAEGVYKLLSAGKQGDAKLCITVRKIFYDQILQISQIIFHVVN